MNVEERLNTLEERMNELEKKMENVEARELLQLRDLNSLLDGTDEKPGVLRKLDKLDEIVELLKRDRD